MDSETRDLSNRHRGRENMGYEITIEGTRFSSNGDKLEGNPRNKRTCKEQ